MTKFNNVSSLVAVSSSIIASKNIIFILDGVARYAGIGELEKAGIASEVLNLPMNKVVETYSLLSGLTVILLPSKL